MRVIVPLAALVLTSSAGAQSPARLALLEDWHHQQKHILAVIDSATPEMLGFRTTKGVRTFAEQINHIITVAALIVGGAVADKPLPTALVGDTAVYLHDKAKLRAAAATYLDFVINSLEGLTDDQLTGEQSFAGGSMPKWRWNITALQHSAWTLGQLVPYLRMNGRTPPQFTPF
ncbi:MAG: DinB family protein [Gemmatimonadota bacterium]